jgi:hypothetical protein
MSFIYDRGTYIAGHAGGANTTSTALTLTSPTYITGIHAQAYATGDVDGDIEVLLYNASGSLEHTMMKINVDGDKSSREISMQPNMTIPTSYSIRGKSANANIHFHVGVTGIKI